MVDAHIFQQEQLPQAQAFETHVVAQQQQQQVKSVEEDADEDADAVSSSMVKPNH